jgi:hypothetical protein
MIGLSLEEAVKYVSLPRTVCMMNDLPIIASIGPYGPYLKYNNTFMTLYPKDGDVLNIDGDTAQELVTEGIINRKSKSMVGVLAEIGEKDGIMITVKNGRFGPYINWNKINVNLPGEFRENPSEIPLEEAWSMIQEKAAKAGDTRSTRKKKQPRHEIPPGPKRPLSAYLLFAAEKRPEVAQKFSTLGEVSKELSRLWSETSEKDRKPFNDKAAALKSAYEEEKKKWKVEVQLLIGQQSGGSVSKRSKTAVNGPKRPRSAYIFFCNANRAEVSKEFGTLGEVSKELARRWANLDLSVKQEFENMSQEDKKRYEREKNEGIEPDSSLVNFMKGPVEPISNRRSAPKTRVNAKTKKVALPSKKRPPSAYMIFCSRHRKTVSNDENGKKLSLPETTKILAQMWKDLDNDSRAEFISEAESLREVAA